MFSSKLPFLVLILLVLSLNVHSHLSPNFYSFKCPNALSIVKNGIAEAIKKETRVGASLLRLHFHDCFVNGCDGSILLDDTSTFKSEKTSKPNNNSARGFEVVDHIKANLEKACPGTVSCADILAIAARDAVVHYGGPTWKVKLGRRDSLTANRSAANAFIPQPSFNLSNLTSSFAAVGLSFKDMVVLSGGHTVGFARCTSFRPHIYNDSNIDSTFAKSLQQTCPPSGNDNLFLAKPISARSKCESNMACGSKLYFLLLIIFGLSLKLNVHANLSPNFYSSTCPQALDIVKHGIAKAIKKEARVGASILRLHFHDCFVNGCDGSILLDSTPNFQSEKTAAPNNNSARGFEVVDQIKAKLEKACPGIVSCADILAIIARDAVVLYGGPTWKVKLGRRDSRTASVNAANSFIPQPTFNLDNLISSFARVDYRLKTWWSCLHIGSAHTVGLARCTVFRSRIYNDTDISGGFAKYLQKKCPKKGNDNVLQPLDYRTEYTFDDKYYKNLLYKKGLLHSDQQLYNGNKADSLVKKYSKDQINFFKAFAKSMIRMGNINPLTGSNGEIRRNCRKPN
ncbi:Cationic peroxidase 1 [Bienertia sinuspersici]